MFKIEAPATSANLGPGFDSFGIAFDLANIYYAAEIEEGIVINGLRDDTMNKGNLIVKSFLTACDEIGYRPKGLQLSVKTKIPLSRGLGSSASCISAGVAMAFMFAGKQMIKTDLFEIAAQIEGHPDNVAPAIFGGATVSYAQNGLYKTLPFDICEKYHFCALVPDFKVSTQKAREVLPLMYSREDAVFNISRSAVFVLAASMGNDLALIDALSDKLHEPFRKDLIFEYEEVMQACRDAELLGTYISGAGPTIMGIFESSTQLKLLEKSLLDLKKNWKMIPMTINYDGLTCYKREE